MANILVVEDREDWQDIVSAALAEEGYTPYPVGSYEEATTALEKREFSLAIVDPVLDRDNRFNRDGLSVVQRIRELYPNMPVIIITGSLTHDLASTLQHICPRAPILSKESWDPETIRDLLYKLVGKQAAEEWPDQTPQAGESSRPASLPPETAATGRPRILVVENRQDWQSIVASTLDEAGYFWRVANDGQEALREMEQEHFHLVILDLKLRQNDLPLRSNEGWLLLDHIVETWPKTKVVVLSGRAGPGDVATLLTHYPIVRFIEKQSFSPEAIHEAVAQATQSPNLRIQTLGQFRIWRDDQPIEVWEQPQVEMIIKLLLARRARGGYAVAADELITRLWPDASEESGRKKLLPLISLARHALEPHLTPRDSSFILRSANGYFFDLSGKVAWDLIELRDHWHQGQEWGRERKWEKAIDALKKGRSLYRGDFLAEEQNADWILDIRRQIAAEFCDLLIHLADAYAALGQYPQAIATCEVALNKDPLLESVYRRLMRFHYCNGSKNQALKVYRDCRKLFGELFGESPTPTTVELYEAITNDQVEDCLPEV